MIRALIRRSPSFHHWLARMKYLLSPAPLPGKVGEGTFIHPMAMFSGPMDGVEIGENVRIRAYAQVGNTREARIRIGNRTTLAEFAVVQNAMRGASIEIGHSCSVQRYTIIYGAGPVRIGNYCRIAAHTVIVPVNKTFDDPDQPIHNQPLNAAGITIGDNVWIGAGVRILDGVTIGESSVVAAGAVVTRSFGPMSVIAGVPARLVRTRAQTKVAEDIEP